MTIPLIPLLLLTATSASTLPVGDIAAVLARLDQLETHMHALEAENSRLQAAAANVTSIEPGGRK